MGRGVRCRSGQSKPLPRPVGAVRSAGAQDSCTAVPLAGRRGAAAPACAQRVAASRCGRSRFTAGMAAKASTSPMAA
jgi:hypothetical protein